MPAKSRHICILTSGQVGNNPRVVKEADALFDAGFEVTVVTIMVRGRMDLVDSKTLRWTHQAVDLRPAIRWKPLRALEMASQRLERWLPHRLVTALAFSTFTVPLMVAARDVHADLYIAHYPPALPAAAAAAARNSAQYAYDAEDFHVGDWPDDPLYDDNRRRMRAIEGHYLPGCAYVTAASPMIAEALEAEYGIERPTCLLNVFPLSQAPSAADLPAERPHGPSIYWFSQTIGADRGLECAVRAIGRCASRPHLYLRGMLATGFGRRLEELAEQAGAQGRVHILPPIAANELERDAAKFDLGLVSETGATRNHKFCLANKQFSYLLAGLPPLMSDTPSQRQFAELTGLTELVFPVDDDVRLAALIDTQLSDPVRLKALRRRVWDLGQGRYNWDRELDILISRVRDVLGADVEPSTAVVS